MKPEILLKAYVQYHSEDAFRELVASTLDEVYSTSLRITQGTQRLAEETTFNTYLALARHARGMREDVALSSWLRQRACKIAVKILRAGERDIDWAIVKREKDVRLPAQVQPAPPGLAIYICQTVFLTVRPNKGFRLKLPRISWLTRIRPMHVCGAGVCALALMVWWHNPFHRHNKIIRSEGVLMTPASLAQLASPEEWEGPVTGNPNTLTNINKK